MKNEWIVGAAPKAALSRRAEFVVVTPVRGGKPQDPRAHRIEVGVGLLQLVGPIRFQVGARELVELREVLGAEARDPRDELDVGAILRVIATSLVMMMS